ncbi:MAG: cyclohydrolase [Herbaspirillum sp.]|nr:cyclohydrolase [Herbaspirillum sp.]
MFIISITYIKSAGEIDALLTARRQYLKEHFANGTFLMSGRKVPRNGSVILADGGDRADIEAIVQEDPFFIGDVATYEITEFVPSMTTELLSAFRPTEKN